MRTAPRKTVSNDSRHCSSVTAVAGLTGGPPTEMRAPSSRLPRSRAAVTSRSAASGSALFTAIARAVPVDPRSRASAVSRSAAALTASAWREAMTTCAPSATRHSAAAKPSPRDAPVRMYTRPASPRSMPSSNRTVLSRCLDRRSAQCSRTQPAATIGRCTSSRTPSRCRRRSWKTCESASGVPAGPTRRPENPGARAPIWITCRGCWPTGPTGSTGGHRSASSTATSTTSPR